jgi:hypothetical protein
MLLKGHSSLVYRGAEPFSFLICAVKVGALQVVQCGHSVTESVNTFAILPRQPVRARDRP